MAQPEAMPVCCATGEILADEWDGCMAHLQAAIECGDLVGLAAVKKRLHEYNRLFGDQCRDPQRAKLFPRECLGNRKHLR
ncbi:MAG: hypothetical protein IPK82_23360 [Polyangiaceae bacterium]|nr:hypothetical protein [Polyangiaceae bacterium]